MKCDLMLTQRCNLRCRHCPIGRGSKTMPLSVAKKAIDFIFKRARENEIIDLGFFGGDPLLAFDRIKEITGYMKDHRDFHPDRLRLSITTNGTVFSDAMARFIRDHNIRFVISCDGPPEIQDIFRQTITGTKGSSELVSQTIKYALVALDRVTVNTVFQPATFLMLPRIVEYLSDLGVRHICLTPNYSAQWMSPHLVQLPTLYRQVALEYVRFRKIGTPHFISLVDDKIAVILQNGYSCEQRCQMGKTAFAFSPDGGIYPCKQLLGQADERHRIGHLESGIPLERITCHTLPSSPVNTSCETCIVRDYCRNWCGYTNFFASGFYNRVDAFVCASEKAAIRAAIFALQELGDSAFTKNWDDMDGLFRKWDD